MKKYVMPVNANNPNKTIILKYQSEIPNRTIINSPIAAETAVNHEEFLFELISVTNNFGGVLSSVRRNGQVKLSTIIIVVAMLVI